LTFLLGLLLTDAPRYALSRVVLCLWDWSTAAARWLHGRATQESFQYCPSVCVILAGYNEAETIGATLESVYGSYPRLEIIVVDDGSTDGMAAVARRYARTHPGVCVLSRPERGGKSSAMNFALAYVQAEVVVVVDADSHLGPAALWEIVQPFQKPRVGAVAGNVVARNPFVNLCTWMQAYEYLNTIFIGRMLAERLGILGIVSGAHGAFRTDVLRQVHGWDVGPPEDLDLTLTIRKAGYDIAFAPYACCYTEVPENWKALVKQRRRWERSGVVRNHCRKHLDMVYFWQAHFRWSNLLLFMECWFFNVFCTLGIWVWFAWFFWQQSPDSWHVLFTLYCGYIALEVVQVLAILNYSTERLRHALICTVFLLAPFYQVLMLAVRLWATVEEIFFRGSFEDDYVPLKVRQATWNW
jgi:cellulose synthase/poly-beta-1,6-N-acetylglucosamine synthase-like glycosyltransferase